MLERGLGRAEQLPGNKSAVRQFAIARARDILRAAGVVDPALEGVVQAVASEETQAPTVDLRLQTLEFLSAHTFREPTTEERKILSSKGYDTVLSTDAQQLSVVVTKNRDHFWSGELDYVNARPELRDYVPPALTVALRSEQLFLENSFGMSQPGQLQMVEAESQSLQGQLPDARVIMLPASTYAMLDLAFLKEGGKLFRDKFTRALDQTSGGIVAGVGRFVPADRLGVNDWVADSGLGLVGALSAVVFIQK